MDPDDKATGVSSRRRPPWLRGAVTSAAGVLVGSLALALFCYALGLNFSDEGWPQDQPINRFMLVLSLAGFALAILIFWLGFFQTTYSR